MKTKIYIQLIAVYFIYALSVLFSKMAGLQDSNMGFIFYYLISLGFMGIYAILWQLVLKKIDLSKAYPFKCFTILFALIFGFIIWHEPITLKMIIGIILIFSGVILVGAQDE